MSARPIHSHSLVAKVHAAAFANLARKVQDGKQLTTAEMKALNEAKRESDNQKIADAEQIARDGLKVMAEIRRIIISSKLPKSAKDQIFAEMADIEKRCTDL